MGKCLESKQWDRLEVSPSPVEQARPEGRSPALAGPADLFPGDLALTLSV